MSEKLAKVTMKSHHSTLNRFLKSMQQGFNKEINKEIYIFW